MEFAQFIAVIFGVCFSVIQIKEIADVQLSRKDDLALVYYDRLTSDTNGDILDAIANHKPLLAQFTRIQMDDFLNDLEGVGDRIDRGLFDSDTICSDFSDITMKTYTNSEIQEYLHSVRITDAEYFKGFDRLFNFTVNSCS